MKRLARVAGLWALALAWAPAGAAQIAEPAKRIGFYQWLGVQDPSGPADLLTQARERAVETGARVFRHYLGARYDYVHPVLSPARFAEIDSPRALTPANILSLPRYRAVLEDPRIDTVVLTVYSMANYGSGPDDINLLRPWTAREQRLVETQFGALCQFLYQNFGGAEKTIILANNEADEKLLEILNYSGLPDLALDNLRRWFEARQQAVETARDRFRGSKLRVLHALEISLVNLVIVRDGGRFRKGVPWPEASGREAWNVLRDVVPQTRFDLLSYSAYETANSPYQTQNTGTPPEDVAARMRRDLDRIVEAARDSVSDYGRKLHGNHFVMIGELGYARERFEHLASGGVLPRLQQAMRAALEWGCPYVVLWQVFDAPRNGGEAWGFGIYNSNGEQPELRAPEGSCDTVAECVSQVARRGFPAERSTAPFDSRLR